MKLRKLKKAQAKASRDARLWTSAVPVMDVPAPGALTASLAVSHAPGGVPSMDRPVDAPATGELLGARPASPGDPAPGDAGREDAAPGATPRDAAPGDAAPGDGAPGTAPGATERTELVETMYQAAHARLEAAEARELAADKRLAAAEAAEREAMERLAAAELRELAIAERLAAADERERVVAERLVAAEERERAAAARVAAAEAREEAADSRAAAAEARERASIERDTLALQRDRLALERDGLAIERERAMAEHRTRPEPVEQRVPGGVSAGHELEIARLEAELERAHLDSLTGALRREIGRLTLHNEIERARRTDGRFVLAFVDVDDLKGINDREGHAAGDRVLRTLAATLRANLRTYDPVVRYGGDEFVCGVTGVNVSELEHRMTLIDQSLRRATGVGISAGMATLLEGETLDEITARADAALLEAKRNRDR